MLIYSHLLSSQQFYFTNAMLDNTSYLWVAALAASSTFAQSTPTNASNSTSIVPQVQLDQGTFNGVHNGTVDKFLGIHYAKPPSVHNLLFYHLICDNRVVSIDGTTSVSDCP